MNIVYVRLSVRVKCAIFTPRRGCRIDSLSIHLNNSKISKLELLSYHFLSLFFFFFSFFSVIYFNSFFLLCVFLNSFLKCSKSISQFSKTLCTPCKAFNMQKLSLLTEIFLCIFEDKKLQNYETVCQRSLDPPYILSYYKKWAKTSWT